MSSVCAHAPMFGVSALFFQGIGLRHMGMPSTICCALARAGGKTITSYFALRSAILATSWVLM